MNNTFRRLPIGLALIAAAAACEDGVGPVEEVTECTTTVAQVDAFVELCALDVPVGHVRLENVKAPRTHADAMIVFGFDAAPTVPARDLEIGADQLGVLLYGGGVPFPPPVFQATFSETDASLGDDNSFINDGGTVCLDIHNGSATTSPVLIVWVDGINEADCETRSTLTGVSAYAVTAFDATGAIDLEAKNYFRQAAEGGTTPVIHLFADRALESPPSP